MFVVRPRDNFAMACAIVATVSVAAAPVAVAQIGESRVLSRQSAVLAAPIRSKKLVCNRSRIVMR